MSAPWPKLDLSPGPIERKWSSRVYFRVFGRWPQGVVDERMGRVAEAEIQNRVAFDRWLREQKKNQLSD